MINLYHIDLTCVYFLVRKGRTADLEGTSLAEYTGFSGTQMGPTPLALERAFHLPYVDYHPEAFFSVQLEKVRLKRIFFYV